MASELVSSAIAATNIALSVKVVIFTVKELAALAVLVAVASIGVDWST